MRVFRDGVDLLQCTYRNAVVRCQAEGHDFQVVGGWPVCTRCGLMQEVFTYRLRRFHDERGDLVVVEGELDVPFQIARVFTLHNVPAWSLRGDHTHKMLRQVVRAANGTFLAVVDGEQEFVMCRIDEALYVGPGHHLTLKNFTQWAVAEVFCNLRYDEEDYVG